MTVSTGPRQPAPGRDQRGPAPCAVSTVNGTPRGQVTPTSPTGSPSADMAVDVVGVADQVAALSRAVVELGGLDGLAERVDELAGRVDELAELVAQLAEHTAAACCPPTGELVAPSWLALPPDVEVAAEVLADLAGWLGAVYLRYPDAAGGLPECWLWHPDLVEELLWLRHAWAAAYEASSPSAVAAGEWHERYRPGVVARIRAVAGACSLENHQPRPDRRAHHQPATTSAGPVVVPLAGEAIEAIVTWWGGRRDEPAPRPTAEHLAAAGRWHRGCGR